MATNLATLNVYNHYLTAYAPKGSSSFDTHKKSELRSIYNSIVKQNKESPLYLLNDSDESKAYAVGLKEDARELQHTISSLGTDIANGTFLNKKEAFSSNESIATATFVGTNEEAAEAPTLSLEVKQLASPQVNMGNFLPSDMTVGLSPNVYSFDLNINELNYEFQFQVRPNDTNKDIQERLTRLINNADIGIKADLLTDQDATSLKLTSALSGAKDNGQYHFRVSDDQTSMKSGVVDYLGIGTITREASNAEFVVNGQTHTANANSFTIEKMYEVNLQGVSPEEELTTEIGIKPDIENLTENLKKLVGGYNNFLRSAMEYTEKHPKSNQLVSEMWHIAGDYSSHLGAIGMEVSEDGSIEINEDTLTAAAIDGSIQDGFDTIKGFANSLYQKSQQINLNPMTYVEKTIVAYKNPGKNFASPYITSNYSGMLFNSYC